MAVALSRFDQLRQKFSEFEEAFKTTERLRTELEELLHARVSIPQRRSLRDKKLGASGAHKLRHKERLRRPFGAGVKILISLLKRRGPLTWKELRDAFPDPKNGLNTFIKTATKEGKIEKIDGHYVIAGQKKKELKGHRIGSQQKLVLQAIQQNPGITRGSLVAWPGIDKHNLSSNLKKLEAVGAIEYSSEDHKCKPLVMNGAN